MIGGMKLSFPAPAAAVARIAHDVLRAFAPAAKKTITITTT